METKHTPGPWKAEYRAPKLYTDRDISIIAQNREIADVIGCDGMATENAHLIAAAPDLLEACKDMASILNGLYCGSCIDMDKADKIRVIEKSGRTAITKAENGS